MRAVRTVVPWLLVIIAVLGLFGSGCEKPTHDNIDKWRRTMKGPAKLAAALGDTSLDAEVRAHAGQALVALDKTDAVTTTIAKLKAPERAAVLAKLTPRLWNDCKLADELQIPTSKQLDAKDALFALRELAAGAERDAIDGYLIDWLTGYYEGRASQGHYSGETIIRALGAKAAPKLIAGGRAILDDPGTKEKIPILGDELLKAIAWTGSPDGIAFLLDIAEKDHGDKTLQARALGAVYYAYVSAPDEPRADGAGLRPVIARLQAIAAAPTPFPQPGENVNVAFELIAVAGKPHCIAPLAVLAAHKEEARRWQGVQQALRCAGPDAIVPMAEALPKDLDYPEGIIAKYFWDQIPAAPAVAESARKLLASSSWVGRLTGIELLARTGGAADVPALRALAKDSRKARGWFHTDEDPEGKASKKADPTLGELAAAAAQRLEAKVPAGGAGVH